MVNLATFKKQMWIFFAIFKKLNYNLSTEFNAK